ncbi:MAG: DUF3999 family protein [Acidobacteria bacterium]|nr:DUF3999 family protein [Acidobacteriota bacterium]
MKRPVVILLVVLLPSAVAAQGPDRDEERSAWRHRRAVVLSGAGTEGGFAALTLAPEVVARSQADLRDVRLVGPDGADVPYVVDRVVERETTRSWAGRLLDTRREPMGPAEEGRGRSVWTVDLGEDRTFDTVRLAIDARDFAKRVRLEASADLAAWRLLRDDAGVFEAPWTPRVRHTTIALGGPERARYLRLTVADDRRSPAVDVSGVEVTATRRAEGEEWTRPVTLTSLGRKASASRYRLDLPATFPLEILRLEADDAAFARRVRVLEVRERGGRVDERPLAEGLLYRVQLRDAALSGECLTLAFATRAEAGEIVLEVEDGDSPPLRRLRLSLAGAAVRLLFAGGPGPHALYYGNEVTRAPLYDLGPVRGRLAASGDLAAASAGPEAENPRYRKAAPLPFAPPRGAPVEVHRWRSVRTLALGGREDLYAVTLAAGDLATLRPDLGDLRIVDEADRQVPYVLETGAAEAREPLTFERASRPLRTGERSVSRYRLLLRDPASGKPLTLPLASVEIDVQEAFFDRPARVLVDAPGRRGERSLFSGRLSRRVEARASVPAPPLVVALDGSRLSELVLEVDEGDNAPLTLTAARAVVRVPRVTLKTGPGAYRLLLGNREARAPRYDLASLRQEVLSYSALAAAAAPAEANPAFRRFAGDYFSDAPPTLLLWGTLLAAVVALLLLTARVIRQPSS